MHRVLENAVLYWLSREVNYSQYSTVNGEPKSVFLRMCTPTIHLPLPNPLSQYIFYGNIMIGPMHIFISIESLRNFTYDFLTFCPEIHVNSAQIPSQKRSQ